MQDHHASDGLVPNRLRPRAEGGSAWQANGSGLPATLIRIVFNILLGDGYEWVHARDGWHQ